MNKKKLIVVVILILLLIVGWFGWNNLASPTKIVLLNFQQFQTTSIIKANEDDFVDYEILSID